MDFRITGLPAAKFAHLAGLPEQRLGELGIRRTRITAPHSAPDRISLRDADPGETVLLLNYEHQPADSPYRSRHAIYVIEGEQRTFDAVNEVPDVMRRRLLSLRAFDAQGTMVDADVVDGREVEPLIEKLLAHPQAAYVHAHYAKRGCYAARIERA
ncbi:DUF1203 domain-containing protein [Ramlibacter sp. PS4R-6]|uniref:DUF1203 domain-containing protein n=1 Tax=Ramlibacter sp. PS4R-6 TaxID=3133438 RepID=UPI0030A19949